MIRFLTGVQTVIVLYLAVESVRTANALMALFVGAMLGLLALRGLEALDYHFVEKPKERKG